LSALATRSPTTKLNLGLGITSLALLFDGKNLFFIYFSAGGCLHYTKIHLYNVIVVVKIKSMSAN
jgi:hypothetical protein